MVKSQLQKLLCEMALKSLNTYGAFLMEGLGITATQYPNANNPQVFYNQVVEEFVKSHKIQN